MLLLALLFAVQVVDPSDPHVQAPAPAPPAPTTATVPAPDPPFEPLGVLPTMGIQLGSGALTFVGLAAGAAIASLIPGVVVYVCFCGPPIAMLVVPAAELAVGDRLGSKRGSAWVPVSVAVIGGTAAMATFSAMYLRGPVEFVFSRRLAEEDVRTLETVGWPVIIVGIVTMIVGPVLAYQLTADDKAPDDDGTRTRPWF